MIVEPFSISKNVEIDAERPDLRRDLHVFVAYVKDREIKRGHRDNLIPKADARRLAKLMSDKVADDEIEADSYSQWLHFVDRVALKLGFVSHDTEGVYAGYTSSAPSFPDNFMQFNAKAYDDYQKKSLAKQESILLELILKEGEGSRSEFFHSSIIGRLDCFSSFGSATGVIPCINFADIRSFLLKLLAELPTGQWLSTQSFIEFLKHKHRHFLIPAKPQYKNKWDQKEGRYSNFREGHPYKAQTAIAETDPDAFERVEGRYIERFLEGVPKLFGYIDVGYSKPDAGKYPMLGGLPTFRVNERLQRALGGSLAEPNVKVTPTFEVYVQSEVYAARVLNQLTQVGELVSDDSTTVYRLTKQKVAAAQASNHSLNVIRLLESLVTTPLPENVRRELADWSEHGEKFVLYSGFSLLETDGEVAVPERFQVECIQPGTYIVRSSKKVFEELEQLERMPLKVDHGESSFSDLPDGSSSALRRKKAKKGKPADSKPQVMLMRVTRVQLLCPDREFLQRLQSVLLGAGCPVEADGKNLSLVYSDRYEPQVGKAIRGLGNEYQVKIEDKG